MNAKLMWKYDYKTRAHRAFYQQDCFYEIKLTVAHEPNTSPKLIKEQWVGTPTQTWVSICEKDTMMKIGFDNRAGKKILPITKAQFKHKSPPINSDKEVYYMLVDMKNILEEDFNFKFSRLDKNGYTWN